MTPGESTRPWPDTPIVVIIAAPVNAVTAARTRRLICALRTAGMHSKRPPVIRMSLLPMRPTRQRHGAMFAGMGTPGGMTMAKHRDTSIGADLIKGAVAGAAATWIMGLATTWMYERESQQARDREEQA